MSLYTISDLHLPLGIDKPMDIFGKSWDNYVERIYENWQAAVKPEDTVVLGGDFSWATYLDESYKDFEFLHGLNGRKILLKGNHDYWWSTLNKLCEFTKKHGFSDVFFLQNNVFTAENIAICGTRGWSLDISAPDDKKIYERELIRLRLSIESAKQTDCEDIYVFTHYPPVTCQIQRTRFHEILKEYGVKKCIYGHLHGASHKTAFEGETDGVEYILSSADYLEFSPILLRSGENE